MTSWPLPQALSSWLLLLTHALDARQRERFTALVGGALFARGRRAVTSWLRGAGITTAFKPCYRLLSRLARSTDDGRTFINFAFDNQPFQTAGEFIGDYLAITAQGNKVFGAWARQAPGDAKTERGKNTRSILRVGVADFTP